MAEITITSNNFEKEIAKSDMPILLDFWATWCGPCKMISPIIKEISDDFEGVFKVGKVNVDEQPELASAFQVSSIPMLVIIKNGKITDTSVGYKSKEEIVEMMKKQK